MGISFGISPQSLALSAPAISVDEALRFTFACRPKHYNSCVVRDCYPRAKLWSLGRLVPVPEGRLCNEPSLESPIRKADRPILSGWFSEGSGCEHETSAPWRCVHRTELDLRYDMSIWRLTSDV